MPYFPKSKPGKSFSRPGFGRSGGGAKPNHKNSNSFSKPNFGGDSSSTGFKSSNSSTFGGQKPRFGGGQKRSSSFGGGSFSSGPRPDSRFGGVSSRPSSFGNRNSSSSSRSSGFGDRAARPSFGDRAPRPSFGDRPQGERSSSNSGFGGRKPFNHDRGGSEHRGGGFAKRGNFSHHQGQRGGGQQRSRFNHTEFDVKGYFASKPKGTVEKPTAYASKRTFNDFALNENIKKNLTRIGYVAPTHIQDEAIEPILVGKDLVGIANTGTGKTAAFLLPLLQKYIENNTNRALIIVPARELAVQIQDELSKYAAGSRVRAVLCIGGLGMGPQIQGLRQGSQFVIGTPGRIKDLIQQGQMQMEKFTAVVLDEVDRMLDMGFINDMQFIIGKLPQQRQSLFFSATMDDATEKIMKQFVHEYVKVSVRVGETAAGIDQQLVEVDSQDAKSDKLVEILKSRDVVKALVFVRTKHGADKLAKRLDNEGIKVDSLHGNKSQNYRQRAMRNLRDNKIQTIVATDVAARGLDISGLSHVINFDLPSTKEDYIHRIGRVGRGTAGVGVAISFVSR